MASAVSRISCALTSQPKWFQLFQPMGGVRATPLSSGGLGAPASPSNARGATKRRKRMKASLSAQDLFRVLAVRVHLPLHHLVVRAAGAHQLVVRAPLDDAAVLHQQNQVGAPHGREAVGDHERDRKSTRLNSSHMSISYAD